MPEKTGRVAGAGAWCWARMAMAVLNVLPAWPCMGSSCQWCVAHNVRHCDLHKTMQDHVNWLAWDHVKTG
jgi:hypothetical protein